MNKSILLKVLICLFVYSCSSTPESSSVSQEIQPTDLDSSSSNNNSVDDDKPIDVKPIQESKKQAESSAVATAAAKTSSDKLVAAIKSQNDETVVKSANEVLSQNPKDLRALNALGMTYFKSGRNEAALYLINKAIDIQPKSSELYSNLGLIELARGEKRAAIQAFRKGLAINPSDAIIGANLGSIYVAEKEYQKAELALEIPYKKGTKDIKVLNNYAIALTGNKNSKKAGDIYAKLVRDNPAQRDIMLNYAINLITHQQKYKDGLDLLNRLKFVGIPVESRNVIKDLETQAKAGLQ